MATPQKQIQSPQIVIADNWIPDAVKRALQLPVRSHLGQAIREVVQYVAPEGRDALETILNRLCASVVVESNLYIVGFHYDERTGKRERIVHGDVGWKLVTDNGVAFIVDAFQNLTELENMKFHALGTGSTAEAQTDSALVTELTTEYTGNVRATGSTTEGATANVYRTVGTNTLDGTPGAALREHGIFSQAATGGGVLLDRTVFAAITLSSGDALQTTYDLTVSAGG